MDHILRLSISLEVTAALPRKLLRMTSWESQDGGHHLVVSPKFCDNLGVILITFLFHASSG